MKIAENYMKHPITGETIKPGDMYDDSITKQSINVDDFSLSELRKIAKEKNIEGYSKMDKSELLEVIRFGD